MTTLDREAVIAEMAEALRKCLYTKTGNAIAAENVHVFERAAKALEAYRALPAQPVAVSDVVAERNRQKSVEGWTAAHDDQHIRGEMALAAACYAIAEFPSETAHEAARSLWPWGDEWWKPKGFRRNLVRAAALILAEIERLDRIIQRRPELAEPALAAPSQQEGVTEEMVQAALNAVPDDPRIGGGSKVRTWLGRPPEMNEIIMRAALEAALEAALVDRDRPNAGK